MYTTLRFVLPNAMNRQFAESDLTDIQKYYQLVLEQMALVIFLPFVLGDTILIPFPWVDFPGGKPGITGGVVGVSGILSANTPLGYNSS